MDIIVVEIETVDKKQDCGVTIIITAPFNTFIFRCCVIINF